MPSCIQVLLLILLVSLASPIRAQQPPAPVPPSQQAATSKGDQNKKKQAEKQGKTNLEKETGTVNDRILEVMPNYGTVEGASALPPISSGQKYRLATAGVFDYFTYPFIGFLAALDQANNSPRSWGKL
ncbi:MAG: hypothetical protein ACYDCD_09250 [Candidatus Acidiferrales bacterium]